MDVVNLLLRFVAYNLRQQVIVKGVLMCNDVDIRAVEDFVFGKPPTSTHSSIGRDIAIRYFSPLIDRLETDLASNMKPDMTTVICLEKALSFSSYDGFQRFPKETRQAIKRCEENFRTRYQPLIEKRAKRS